MMHQCHAGAVQKGPAVPLSFMSWSETEQTCDGIKEVRRTQLKNRTKEADFLNAEMVEEYIGLDTMENRRF